MNILHEVQYLYKKHTHLIWLCTIQYTMLFVYHCPEHCRYHTMYQRIHVSYVIKLQCPVQQQDKDAMLGLIKIQCTF